MQSSLNRHGQNALHDAVRHCTVEIVAQLIEEGVNVNHVDNFGHTPLYYAMDAQRGDTVNLLIHNGAHL